MTTNTSNQLSGIDIDALQGAIDAIRENPAAGQSRWAIRSGWVGGTRTDHHVEGNEIGGQATNRPFTMRVDEPLEQLHAAVLRTSPNYFNVTRAIPTRSELVIE